MSSEEDLEKLTAEFRRLGADDPEEWASFQISHGTNQLARFVFLSSAWAGILSEDNDSWTDVYISRAETHPDAPFSGIGHALKSLKSKGATDSELTDVVRGMQAELLFGFCYLLGDPEVVHQTGILWKLFQVDEEGEIIDSIDGLEESVTRTDPTGREMRPRKRA